jgi:chromosome segregation ATPase
MTYLLKKNETLFEQLTDSTGQLTRAQTNEKSALTEQESFKELVRNLKNKHESLKAFTDSQETQIEANQIEIADLRSRYVALSKILILPMENFF